jgi:hypothetical protein
MLETGCELRLIEILESRSIENFELPSIERFVRANLSNNSFTKPGTDYMFYTIEPSIQQCQVSEFKVSVLGAIG